MNSIALGAACPEDVREALAELSELTGQAIDVISDGALRAYLAWRGLQEADLQTSIKQADREEFASKDEVIAVFARYGATS